MDRLAAHSVSELNLQPKRLQHPLRRRGQAASLKGRTNFSISFSIIQ